jgi:hypothetical protein
MPMSRLTGLSTAEFDRRVATGEIREGSRTYLWDGEVCELMSENPPHVITCERLRRLLESRLDPALWTLFVGRPVELSDGYKPQPDLSVLRGPLERYADRAPGVADVALVVEVADSSVHLDRGRFLRRCALDGIVQYWIVNIPARRVEVYRDPDRDAGEYGDPVVCGPDAGVPLILTRAPDEPALFPDIAVADILGRSPGRTAP